MSARRTLDRSDRWVHAEGWPRVGGAGLVSTATTRSGTTIDRGNSRSAEIAVVGRRLAGRVQPHLLDERPPASAEPTARDASPSVNGPVAGPPGTHASAALRALLRPRLTTAYDLSRTRAATHSPLPSATARRDAGSGVHAQGTRAHQDSRLLRSEPLHGGRCRCRTLRSKRSQDEHERRLTRSPACRPCASINKFDGPPAMSPACPPMISSSPGSRCRASRRR